MNKSLKRDFKALSVTLREARLGKQLTQDALATKLDLGQRQISDLERGTVDVRVSTLQNVARALDLDLTLIPHHLISAVEALKRAGTDTGKQPLYALGEEDVDTVEGEGGPNIELGDRTEPGD